MGIQSIEHMKQEQEQLMKQLLNLYGPDIKRTPEILEKRYALLDKHSVLDSKILIAEVESNL